MVKYLPITFQFPLGTFLVNILGCFLIGVLSTVFDKQPPVANEIRLFFIVGILGGFTTFSSFGLETLNLLKKGSLFLAVSYLFASLLLGLFSVWMGMKLTTSLTL